MPPLLFPFLGCKIASTLAPRVKCFCLVISSGSRPPVRVYRVNCKTIRRLARRRGWKRWSRWSFLRHFFFERSRFEILASRSSGEIIWDCEKHRRLKKHRFFFFSFAIISIILESLSRLLMDVKPELLLVSIFATIPYYFYWNRTIFLTIILIQFFQEKLFFYSLLLNDSSNTIYRWIRKSIPCCFDRSTFSQPLYITNSICINVENSLC